MSTSRTNEPESAERLVANDDRSLASYNETESLPPYAPRDERSTVYNAEGATESSHATTSNPAPSDSKKGSGKGRAFLDKLKKLEDKFIGTEEERARQRAEMEREKEEDVKRQEMAYQKQVKRQRRKAKKASASTRRRWRSSSTMMMMTRRGKMKTAGEKGAGSTT